MAGWAREIVASIAEFNKGAEAPLMAKRVLLAAIKKNGGVVYNCSGVGNSGDAGDFTWQVPYRQAQFRWGQIENGITPERQQRWQRAGLAYVDAWMADFMTKKEKLRNGGKSQLINVYENMSKSLSADAFTQFSKELYTDSTATGNSTRPSGIESFMGINGTLDVTATTVSSHSSNAADVAANPSATYAGLSTILGATGGSWTVGTAGINYQWPAGRGDQQYDYFSPIITNYTSTAWGGSSATWAFNGEKATRYLATHMGKYQTDRGDSLQLIMMDRDLYRQFLDLYAGKERTMITSESKLRALGFNGISMEGVDVTWEVDVPGGVCYGFDTNNIEIHSLQDTLFDVEGPWYEKVQKSYVVSLDFMGQLKFVSPRYFGKLSAVA